jgi:energy-coupling factor transporter ATP-binding protein EcfA2
VTHRLAEVAEADRLVVLGEAGIAYSGPPDPVIGDSERAASLGLEVPQTAVLAAALRAAGIAVPRRALDAESVLEALWG